MSCELFHLIWPDKSSPSIAHRNRQLTFRRNLVRQRIGTFTSRKRTGRKRSLPIGTAFPFHTLQKISGRAKVCALCIDKRKKLHQEGVNRQDINVSRMIFHCAVWGVFCNTTSSEMWRCKIRWVGYYMHKFITNKLKTRVIILSFLVCYAFFPWRGDRFLVQYVNLNAHWKKRSLSAHAGEL